MADTLSIEEIRARLTRLWAAGVQAAAPQADRSALSSLDLEQHDRLVYRHVEADLAASRVTYEDMVVHINGQEALAEMGRAGLSLTVLGGSPREPIRVSVGRGDRIVIGEGRSEGAAWIDARNKLKAASWKQSEHPKPI